MGSLRRDSPFERQRLNPFLLLEKAERKSIAGIRSPGNSTAKINLWSQYIIQYIG
jgi:hypothetical protein